MQINEIKVALDEYFGMTGELGESTKMAYGSEYASITYRSPTGRILCILQLVRNTSNKGEWYFSGNYVPHTDLQQFLRGLPTYSGYTHKDANGKWMTRSG